MAATATMEAAAATTVKSAAATDATAEAASYSAAAIAIAAASIAVAASEAIAATVAVAHASITVTATEAVAPTEPRTRADKESAAEPGRAIIPIGCAGVRSVAIVAIRTDGSGVVVSIASISGATDSNTHCDLSMRISRCGDQQDTEHSKIT